MDNRSTIATPFGAPAVGYGGAIAAQNELAVNRMHSSFTVEGSGSVSRMTSLPRGQIIDLHFTGAPTFINSANLVCHGGVDFIAAPGDMAIARSEGNGKWRIIPLPGAGNRERLTTNRTYYVSTAGSDSNNGRTLVNPFQTVQKAWDVIADTLDGNGHYATVQVADGIYTAGIHSEKGTVGFPAEGVIFKGNFTTPSNVLIQTTGIGAIQLFQTGGPVSLSVRDMKLEALTSGDCVFASSQNVYVALWNVVFGQCDVGIRCYNNAEVDILSASTVSASPRQGIFAYTNAGAIIAWQNINIILSGTPNFSNGFVYTNGGQILIQTNTYTGAATGPRYGAIKGSMIDTAGGGPNALPGSAAGFCDGSSSYDGIPGNGPGSLVKTTIFTTSGTWSKSALCNTVVVELRAGGGGGGGVSSAAAHLGAGGGGQGGRAIKRITAPGATETVVVGAGGTAGSNTGGGGGAGGNSSFGSWFSAGGGPGGAGATTADAYLGGAGGTASGGDLNFTGQAGGVGLGIATLAISGHGGGEGGGGSVGNSAGGAGVQGGGGSGAASYGSNASLGGAGGAGWVIVYEYQ